MPRQGVPYPSREICSLKCQIDALQRQINELMKSINGVQGDGQGNVSLVSGDPAVVINNNASQNQIEIALDQSELPAAAVRMVNGMTGAVVLAANDIYAGANTVGFEIADLKAENLLRKQGITNEISNRQAADAALQANINTLQASIPGEAAQAVANDPTVQGLVTADAQNVKLGGSQNITGVKTVPTEATGSATQQIANGAKVKNELDAYAPMVRTTGNQTISGSKEFINPIKGQMFELAYFGSNTNNGWYAIAKFPKVAREIYLFNYTPGNFNIVLLETNTHTINVIKWVGNYVPNQNRFMWVETSNAMILYVYSATYRTNILNLVNYSVYGTPTALSEIDKSVFTGQPVAKPTVGGDIIATYDETLLNLVTQ